MTVKRKPRRLTTRRKKQTTSEIPSDDMRQAWLLIQSLTCALISKLESVLMTHDACEKGWERLFGAKDSTVINLQKLVTVLGEISDRLAHHAAPDAAQENVSMPMNAEDMAMLRRWLEHEMRDAKQPD